MRPDRRWMQASTLAVMLLCLNADGEEPACTPTIEVKRNTTFKVAPGEELRIICKVSLCEDKPPNVSWYKYEGGLIPIGKTSQSRFKTEWVQLSPTAGNSYLIFKSAVRNDSGQFQCRLQGEISNFINVVVSDEFRNNSTTENPDPEPPGWLYVCSAGGIAALVAVVVVVSVVAMRGCKGKSKEEEQAENQYLAIPMAELTQPPPRGSPVAPPGRRSIRRKTQDGEEERGRAAREDRRRSTSIVYAALNHPPSPRGGAWPRRPAEAPSEYAAIRVA